MIDGPVFGWDRWRELQTGTLQGIGHTLRMLMYRPQHLRASPCRWHSWSFPVHAVIAHASARKLELTRHTPIRYQR